MFVYSYILLSMVKTYGPKIGPLKKKLPDNAKRTKYIAFFCIEFNLPTDLKNK